MSNEVTADEKAELTQPDSQPPVTESIHTTLVYIQSNLKTPKGRRNEFGGFDYRSAEDILEAVKPLLTETNSTVLLKDNIVMVGDRIYVKAVAEFTACGEVISVPGFAREPLLKKGMDESQLTGSTSSYARKYALSGLFAIDDSIDSDSTNESGPLDQEQIANLEALIQEVEADKEKFLRFFNIGDINALPADRYEHAIKMLEAKR